MADRSLKDAHINGAQDHHVVMHRKNGTSIWSTQNLAPSFVEIWRQQKKKQKKKKEEERRIWPNNV
jgi:hypothetical protein